MVQTCHENGYEIFPYRGEYSRPWWTHEVKLHVESKRNKLQNTKTHVSPVYLRTAGNRTGSLWWPTSIRNMMKWRRENDDDREHDLQISIDTNLVWNFCSWSETNWILSIRYNIYKHCWNNLLPRPTGNWLYDCWWQQLYFAHFVTQCLEHKLLVIISVTTLTNLLTNV